MGLCTLTKSVLTPRRTTFRNRKWKRLPCIGGPSMTTPIKCAVSSIILRRILTYTQSAVCVCARLFYVICFHYNARPGKGADLNVATTGKSGIPILLHATSCWSFTIFTLSQQAFHRYGCSLFVLSLYHPPPSFIIMTPPSMDLSHSSTFHRSFFIGFQDWPHLNDMICR